MGSDLKSDVFREFYIFPLFSQFEFLGLFISEATLIVENEVTKSVGVSEIIKIDL
jgi:hypothetical protein